MPDLDIGKTNAVSRIMLLPSVRSYGFLSELDTHNLKAQARVQQRRRRGHISPLRSLYFHLKKTQHSQSDLQHALTQ